MYKKEAEADPRCNQLDLCSLLIVNMAITFLNHLSKLNLAFGPYSAPLTNLSSLSFSLTYTHTQHRIQFSAYPGKILPSLDLNADDSDPNHFHFLSYAEYEDMFFY